MPLRRTTLVVVAIASSLMLIAACKDMGHDLPSAGRPVLQSSKSVVNLSPSQQDTLTITGGNPPYRVSQSPDPALATVLLTSTASAPASLIVTAASTVITAGTTSVKIKDTDTHDSPTHEEQEITIAISVSPLPISFSSQIQTILTANCAVAGCHVSGGSGPMSLVAGVSYGNLVGVTAVNGPCAGDLRVQPSDPDASALIKRLRGTCGPLMPQGGPALPPAEIQRISDWIDEGANNN